jgi:hypothetical protein
MTRQAQPRTFLKEHNQRAFEYPFRCLCSNGILKTDITYEESRYYHQTHTLDEILKPLPTIQTYDPGNFPNNIKKWIWSTPDPWHLVCILDNGHYAYFHASRDDDASFDNPDRSQMSLYISPDIQTLIVYAFTEATYNLYISQTAPLWQISTQKEPKNIVSMMENFALCE